MQNRRFLPKGVYINDDYSVETQKRINRLRPVLRKAKLRDAEAKLVADKLIYKGRAYTLNTISSIDFDLEDLSTSTSQNVVAFAGRYSVFSNLYPCQITIDGQQFSSNEQFFQYQKCKEAGRDDVAAKVLLCTQPESAMSAGKEVQMTKAWSISTGKKY